ncbi:MAG TPA: glucosamine-6-phosphate synthase, partial [Acidimicrobiaceae bacterium]|nr:glucosamine-6-phosphate synthase [Acidimicrobiaceae bacterium]
VGQGTAAAAASALPHFFDLLLGAAGSGLPSRPRVSAQLASELSGFGLRDDMSDTLVVAVSQSGTTNDVNRTVELVRARGAAVVAIVNRRGSDLTEHADGVLHTSDGRDVEMSVASTKAFYAQVAAVALLSAAIAAELAQPDDAAASDLLEALESMPAAIAGVLAGRADIARVARRHIGSRRHWSVVGNGPNQTAAREVRIKLSELCYHAVAVDATEDKKHIDLSSEPLVVVCAAGLSDSVAADVAKEVDILRAHRATPIVITDDAARFGAAADVLVVPHVHPALDFVLATVAGHLFSYEAALAIDALALPLREMRVVVEAAIADGAAASADILDAIAAGIEAPATRLRTGLRAGDYDGHLRVATALRLSAVLPFAQRVADLEQYQQTLGKVGRPTTVVDDLAGALNAAVDELTRPVDAVKHQAKSVTVGTSRSEESLLSSVLVSAALAAGAPRDRLGYVALQTLAALDPAVSDVVGYTRYRIDGDVAADSGALHEGAIDLTRPPATIAVVDRGGIALDIRSRTDADPRLRGTKHRAAFEREVTVGRGSDGRTVVHIPETKDGRTTGLTLLHCRFAPTIAAHRMRAVLRGYRGRYGALCDAVTEFLPELRDDVLGRIDVVDLLTRPVHVLAENWIAPTRPDADVSGAAVSGAVPSSSASPAAAPD